MVVSWAVLIVLTGFTIYAYPQLPGQIPTHFNLQGLPDGYGSRKTIFALPAFAALTLLMISLPVFIPGLSKYNFPGQTTPAQQTRLIALSMRMLHVCMVTVVLLFCLLTLEIYLISAMGRKPFGAWYLVLCLLTVLGPITYYLWKMRQVGRDG